LRPATARSRARASSRATRATGDCTVLVAWHIDERSFGSSTNLSGRTVAGAFHSPGNMLSTKWRAALYIDAGVSKEQTDALTRIFGGQAGGVPGALGSFIGEVAGVKSAKIEHAASEKARRVKISQIAEAEIEAIQGKGGDEVHVEGHPLAVSPGNLATVAMSKKLSLHDLGFEAELSSRSGLYAPFKYSDA
jgi:hypothetical protein